MFFRKQSRNEDLSDRELISRYKGSGENSWVGILYERYALQIYAICKKYIKDEEETRDIAMQIFEYLLKELQKYEIDNFKSWLGTATRNYCLMQLRKVKSLQAKEEDYRENVRAFVETESNIHPSNGEDKEAALTALEEALQSLKPGQRTCVELFYLKEKSYKEVSDATGLSMNEVKSNIQNGKRNLKVRLSQSNE